MTESYAKSQLAVKLNKIGVAIYRFEDMFRANVPDALVAYEGKSMWVEVKLCTPGNITEPWKWKAYRAGQCLGIEMLAKQSGIPAYYYAYGAGESILVRLEKLQEAIATRKPLGDAAWRAKGYQELRFKTILGWCV